MKYHKALKQNKGFSLLEVLISLAIMVILLGVTTPFVLHFYKRYQSSTERNLLVSLFREARTMSLAGHGSANHGVHIASGQYTLFEGVNYQTRIEAKDQTFPRNDNISITGPSDLIFTHLTGRTASVSFILTNATKTERIYVNKEGRIDWQ